MRLLSVDIETYGKCTQSASGSGLPHQTCFVPAKSLAVDGCPPEHLILTAAVTSVSCSWSEGWPTLSTLAPEETRVFLLHLPAHREWLRRWLASATHLCGMNLPFDLHYLLWDTSVRWPILPHNKGLIDLSVVAFQECADRPEKSLKDIGKVLGTHSYSEQDEDRSFRYPSPLDPGLQSYNAQDSHNVPLAIACLAKRIEEKYPGSDKLSPFAQQHWSAALWHAVDLSRHGICMDRPGLVDFEADLVRSTAECNAKAADRNLILEGEGSDKSKRALLQSAVDALHARDDHSIASHPLFTITPKTGKISLTENNRKIIRHHMLRHLDDDPEMQDLYDDIELLGDHATGQKLMSSYVYPLLHHQRADETNRRSLLTEDSPGTWISHPVWFVTPGRVKDDEGESGGTKQGRMSCKDFRHQTDPASIKAFYRSRWPRGILACYDLSQIELRVAALLSGDASMCRAYAKGNAVDLHTERAKQIFGPHVVGENGWEEKYRQPAKHANFTDLYRCGAVKFQAVLLKKGGIVMDLDFCQEVVRSRPHIRPGLWEWQEEWIADTHRQGYAILPFTGQSRDFGGGDEYDVNEICNFPVQTIAGNLMIQLYRHLLPLLSGPEGHGILPVHNCFDALWFDCSSAARVAQLHIWWLSAVKTLTSTGYWSMLVDRYRHPVEFGWGRKLHPNPGTPCPPERSAPVAPSASSILAA